MKLSESIEMLRNVRADVQLARKKVKQLGAHKAAKELKAATKRLDRAIEDRERAARQII